MTRLKALNSPMIPRAKPDTISHFGSSFIMAAGTDKPEPHATNRETEIIQRAQDSYFLCDARICHDPKNEARESHVKGCHQSAEQRNRRTGCPYSEKTEPAYHRCRKDAERYSSAELQECANHNRLRMSLKISRDGITRFPRPGKMRSPGETDDLIKTSIKEQHVNDRNDARMRPPMSL